MDPTPARYAIRIHGHLGATLLSAFPALEPRRHGADTVLTGLLDRSALYGVLGRSRRSASTWSRSASSPQTANQHNHMTAAHRDGHHRLAHRTPLPEAGAPQTSAHVRDPLADHLLTPHNAALLPIDYQPSPLAAVRRAARNASA
jgi:hypothetical protein